MLGTSGRILAKNMNKSMSLCLVLWEEFCTRSLRDGENFYDFILGLEDIKARINKFGDAFQVNDAEMIMKITSSVTQSWQTYIMGLRYII